MRTKHFYLLSAMITLSLWGGCSSDEEGAPSFQSANTIQVNTYAAPLSRATGKTAFVDNDSFVISAQRTFGNRTITDSDFSYIDKAVMKRSSGVWAWQSDIPTWPASVDSVLSFVAFYPSDKITTLGQTSIEYTLDKDVSGHQTDPMFATMINASTTDRDGTAVNGITNTTKPASGAMPLTFKHILSRVKVNVVLDKNYSADGVDAAKLTALSLKNINTKGTFTVDYESELLASGNWKDQTTATDFNFLTISDPPIALDLTASTPTLLCDTLMIPQSFSGSTSSFVLSFTQEVSGGGSKNFAKTIDLPGSWEPNKTYNYTITLLLDNTLFLSTTIASIGAEEKISSDDMETMKIMEKAVDLGLPSGTLWAKYDMGATTPYVTGTKYQFSLDNTTVKAYTTEGTIAADALFDRATSEWGVGWSTPTMADWEELWNNTTVERKIENGTDGYLFTASNGNTLFFKFAQFFSYNIQYWTSNYKYGSNLNSVSFIIKSSTVSYSFVNATNWTTTNPIRPVYKKP
jgi:hypothetical protein